MEKIIKHIKSDKRLFWASVVVLVLVVIFAGYWIYSYSTKVTKLEKTLQEVSAKLAETEKNNTQLSDALFLEQNKVGELEDQINRTTGALSALEKLKNTDSELLAKYSKVYFLNENYTPPTLTNIATRYRAIDSKPLLIHEHVLPHLEDMIDAAEHSGYSLQVISAYRSFNEQTSLKNSYKVTFGTTAANQFSADQGYSEHQIGTTVDLTTEALGTNFDSFESTDSYKWLLKNAYKYGFILSYPKGNAYYQFEPWHWRFVGVKLATELRNRSMSFYDMDQREINEYLLDIFE